MMTLPGRNDCFHIHTYRCGHAENVSDEAYVRKAIEMGADAIWFSDHSPFPGNPFGGRMNYDVLDEYLETIGGLSQKYKNQIDIKAGLEIEYFPLFDKAGYYQKLRQNDRLDFLLLGQHMAENEEDGCYTFEWNKERLCDYEDQALGNAILQGIKTGYFDIVAHPDRIFRRKKTWDARMEDLAGRIIDSAVKHHIPLEQNLSSMKRKNQYKPEFWKLAKAAGVITVTGLDAHSIADMDRAIPEKYK